MRESFSGEGEGRMLQAEVLHIQPERGLLKSEKESERESGKRCGWWVGKGKLRKALRSVFVFCAT